MNIMHRPLFDVEATIKHYTEKDGVPIKYVCTSALDFGTNPADVYYRATRHPEYGNHYFGLFYGYKYQIMITNADGIEGLEFDMLEINGKLHYSRDRHDFHTVGDVSIDGGRAYFRLVGNINYPSKKLIVRDGEFVEKVDA